MTTQTYRISAPNGQTYEIQGPPGASQEQVQTEVMAQHPDAANTPSTADPAQPPQAALDQDGTNLQGQFGDDPNRVYSQFAPEDEAHVVELLRTGKDDEAARFAASKGFDITNAADIAKAREQTGAINPDMVYSRPKVSPLDTGGAAGAATRGILDSATLGIAGKAGNLTRAVEDQLSGSNTDFMTDWNREADIRKGVDDADSAEHPWTRFAGQLAGGAILPTGLEGLAARVEAEAISGGASVEQAHAAGLRAIRNRIIQVGGGYGAAHGAFSADNPAGAVTGAVTEGALGAATAGVLGVAGERLASRAPAVPTEGQEVLAAAQRQRIDPLPADVGGPSVRRLTSAAAQAPVSAAPVIKAGARVVEQAQAARDRIAAKVGQALDPEAAGQTGIAGARSYIANSRTGVNAAYAAAESAAGDSRVPATKAIEVLDRNISELSETPGGTPALTQLQGLRDALSSGDVSVAGLRRMRTVLRDQFMKDGLRGSDTERRVGQVMDAAREDVTNGLTAAGKPGAASLFARADAAHAERVQTIDQVIKPLIGTREAPKSGEQVIKTLTADLHGNNARAVRFLRALPPEEQANTRASIIGAMGNAMPGAQNAQGTAFSLPAFLTHWNKMGDTAKRAYFGDEARAALNDLAKVAEGTKQAQSYANRSNSSGGIWGNLGLLAGTAAASPVAAGSGLAAQLIGGHLLASPRFARWLARAPRTALSAPAYVERLSRIARAEPQIANEVLQLQQRLAEAFNPTRLAADQGSGVGASGQPQEQQRETQGAQP